MKKIVLLTLLFAIAGIGSSAQQKHHFQIKSGHFLFDGKPTAIYSGEMHYARVPQQYWKQRLQMIKAIGLHKVATYMC